ncbi:type VI secretion system contractile sheath large subunit, partial [Escherichia coli]|nr:type VI secretion system contractile sheath large subunit [Escherichia coli]MCI5410442.1 type VI secretion system contractile sheath large subunit [Escherichia coli]
MLQLFKSGVQIKIGSFVSKRLVRTVLIFTESSDQLSRATDRVPGLPASPG